MAYDRVVFGDLARPKNTRIAWLSRRMSSSSRRPTSAPTLDFGTVVILSTIRREHTSKPLRSFGSTASRNRGASVSSLVKRRS